MYGFGHNVLLDQIQLRELAEATRVDCGDLISLDGR